MSERLRMNRAAWDKFVVEADAREQKLAVENFKLKAEVERLKKICAKPWADSERLDNLERWKTLLILCGFDKSEFKTVRDWIDDMEDEPRKLEFQWTCPQCGAVLPSRDAHCLCVEEPDHE